ncbi:fimbrillin family protein [Phocaeicola plebeius]|uniref:fimbrillin family protein n=1 Tax=Phocaeicola plebeius TaxID=310297 RepID=UPI0026EBC471|nr:fimbrillin family protein [Phocaeicola plebeius]
MMMVGCSQENVTEQVENNLCTMMVNVTESGFSTMNDDSRVVTSDDYKTSFEDNDQIGLFIVENETGKLLKNMALTKSGSNWEGTVYYYDNADYIAYYPYDAQLKEVASVADIEKYFKENKYTYDQSTVANYRNSDLMTAVVEAESLTETSPLNLNFTHNNALVEFNIPYYSYSTEADGAGYRYSVPVDLTLELGESDTFKPYQVAVGKYRVIVPVGESLAFSGQFTDAKLDKPVYVNAEIKDGLAKNAGMVYNVTYTDSPTVGTIATRPLEPGDYYYADGNIVPNDFTAVPEENCIGVVFATTTKDETALDGTTTCSNGYVMALVDATGNDDKVTSWTYYWGQNNTSIASLYATDNSTDNTSLTAVITDDSKSGFYNTDLIVKSGNYTDKVEYIQHAVTTFGQEGYFTSNYKAPEFTSGWFIPSAAQLATLIKNLGADENGNLSYDGSNYNVTDYDGTQKIRFDDVVEKLNSKLSVVGGSFEKNKGFMTVSVASDYNGSSNVPLFLNHSSSNHKADFIAVNLEENKNNKKNVRLILAF